MNFYIGRRTGVFFLQRKTPELISVSAPGLEVRARLMTWGLRFYIDGSVAAGHGRSAGAAV
jgi:hypothetical protein